ncbi:cell wall hydrolase [Phenylobacterium sp. J426]|uniref:cell wall hydrolase n=1 Tax=Phenylobacterium sp. J426 TaxID=2898439 RepID=UPI002150D0EE|nr:cell wall hydrolase [Phenylobacterium sp. J426]MCR5876568.1 cell wall hydrolase [Phenylobacterium sp. J426]
MSRFLSRRVLLVLAGLLLVSAGLVVAYLRQAHTATLAAAEADKAVLQPAMAPIPQQAYDLARGPQLFQALTPEEARRKNAETPFSIEPIIAARPFKLPTDSGLNHARAVTCLTQAVYYEAANEPLQGRRAVAQVVLNRLRSPEYPKTVCGVVFEGSELPTGCQFTFTCDGSIARPPEPRLWKEAEAVATRALDGFVEPSVGLATHYHTDWVVPYWMGSLVKLKQIGAHIFYRWPGRAGAPQGFQGVYAGVEPAGELLRPLELAALEASPPAAVETSPQAEPVRPATTPVGDDHAAGGAGSRAEAAPLVRPPSEAPPPPGFEKADSWTPQPAWRRF